MEVPDELSLEKFVRRACAFCGAKGPLTKEDAWPRWLNKHLPPQLPGVALDLSIRENQVVRASRRTVTGYNTARVPGFCKGCNNGWMSRLEQAAAPVLLPMIRGDAVTLDRAQQLILATWITKTALVFDQRALGRRPLVAEELTFRFGGERRPVAGSRVLIARYSGSDWMLNHAVSGLPAVYKDGTEKVIVAIVTLCVGKLVMQLVCPADGGETESPGLLQRDDRRFACQLFPRDGTEISWPPEVSLDSAGWFEFGLSHRTSLDIKAILGRIE